MTAQAYTPRPYQRAITGFILDTPRCAIWASMGLGKTVATLTALAALRLTDNRPILVLAPLRVAQTTWPDEARKWSHLSGLTVSPIVGDTGQRLKAIERDADVYTINYDNIPWLTEQYGNIAWPFSTVVADESTRLKSFRLRQGVKRAKALARVMPLVDRFVELTGTPSPNGLLDLWGQMWFVDRGERLGKSFRAFQDRWFRPERVGSSPFAVRYVPLPGAREAIQERLRDVCLSLDAKDWFDITEPITSTAEILSRPPLRDGEQYIGAIITASGELRHTILMPDEIDATWDKSMEWAQTRGGDLPNRIEQAMLFANFKNEFKPEWYWSNTEYAADAGFAWSQNFGSGDQYYGHKSVELFARSVRRTFSNLNIQ
jgi:hypothetical protein